MKKIRSGKIGILLSVVILTSFLFSSTVLAKKRGYLGVSIRSLEKEIKKEMGIYHGVVIEKVTKDSPADKAGFQEDDILLTFNGKKIRRPNDLVYMVYKLEPETEVDATILRNKEKKELHVVIGEMVQKLRSYTRHSNGPIIRMFGSDHGYLGVVMEDMNADLATYFGVKEGEGALIVDVEEGSPAEDVGMKAGDVIQRIENEEIASSSDVCEIISQTDEGDKIKLEVLRHNRKQYFEVEIGERSFDDETVFLKKSKDLDGLNRMKMHIFSPDEYFDDEDFIWEGEIDREMNEIDCHEDLHSSKSCQIVEEVIKI